MSGELIAERLQQLVTKLAGATRIPADASPDTPLRDDGYWLDSVDLVELVVACEHEFGVLFEGETDLTPTALSTVRTLAELIASKRQASA
jgi:acyl carrier protein